jgi:putative serine protease PepD
VSYDQHRSFHPAEHNVWWSPAENERVKSFAPTTTRKAKKVSVVMTVVIALVVGLAGGVGGAFLADRELISTNANLVSVNDTIERAPDSVAGVAERVLPSVVSISTTSRAGSGTGSGFFIRSDGFILTNNHVISDAATANGRITVKLNNGKRFSARVVGRNASYDLAVLKINVNSAPALQFGDSDAIQVGDNVIAIGSPLGLSGTVTAGIISAKNRAVTTGGEDETSFINALQTDAAINPGNSGGPLVNMSGAVVGVNSAIATLGNSFSASGSIGLGFAIPINQAKKTAEQLIATGRSVYPIMGVSIDSRFTGTGALVADQDEAVIAGGPADKAGIKPGDVIIEFEGLEITTSDELIVAIRSRDVGDRVSLVILRDGERIKLSLTLVAGQN